MALLRAELAKLGLEIKMALANMPKEASEGTKALTLYTSSNEVQRRLQLKKAKIPFEGEAFWEEKLDEFNFLE